VLRDKSELRKVRKIRLRKRIRKKIRGTTERPRVHVFKSDRYIYTQVINDETGVVLAAASTLEKEFKEKNKDFKNKKASETLGQILARRLKEKKIERVVLDRGTSPYHGRIKALADAMRKEGVIF
jgi:large subunit ribosomal protein L18